ncbi:MAG: hypothetical protein QM652_06820 [Legionella sp.]|uniref:hypothetical protein n=1 Tax=Legionella sp. TaxID=459 RepID=UPI0039E365E9
MLSRLTLLSIRRTPLINGVGFFAKNFSTYLSEPHSASYLEQQLEELKTKNISAELVTLPQGKLLVGLDINENDNVLGGGIPLYEQDTLNALSDAEKKHWIHMSTTYFARIAKFSIKKDTLCVKAETENGLPIYYVHHKMTKMDDLKPVEELIELPQITCCRKVL